MLDVATLIQQGTSNLWIFIPMAILLGALRGLEFGHSKTMMAAFIIAIRGTVSQAALLGLAATVLHTAVVWVVAFARMYFLGDAFDAETTEPYFQLVSGIIIIAIALWMLHRNWKHQKAFKSEIAHAHDETRLIETGHGEVKLEIYEIGQPPHFRLSGASLSHYAPNAIILETKRVDGVFQTFKFNKREDFLESTSEIPEPHEFSACLKLIHDDHHQDYDLEFIEHGHQYSDTAVKGLDITSARYQDAHEIAHANDIRARFSSQNVTTGQIIAFGLTGGLILCPASITVLLLCLQLKEITLGALLVLCFSVGLALTVVTAGIVAAFSVKQVNKRWSGFRKIAILAPYLSGLLNYIYRALYKYYRTIRYIVNYEIITRQ